MADKRKLGDDELKKVTGAGGSVDLALNSDGTSPRPGGGTGSVGVGVGSSPGGGKRSESVSVTPGIGADDEIDTFSQS